MNSYVRQQRILWALMITAIYGSVVFASGLERVKYNNPGLAVDLGVGLWAQPIPVDYDNDGDNDLIVCCHDVPYSGTYFFENTTGKVKMPVFKAGVRIGPGFLSSIQPSYVDGKVRLLLPGKEIVDFMNPPKRLEQTKKIYSGNLPKSKVNAGARYWRYVDYDGNGALDLIVGMGIWDDYGWDNAYDENGNWTRGPLHGYIYFIRNRASTENPQYDAPVKIKAGGEPIDVYGGPAPNFADFDGDGDLDLICGEFIDKMTWFENIGTRKAPEYAAGKYLMCGGKPIQMDLCMITPVAIDWDEDGDIDLVVGQEDGRVALVENTGRIINNMPEFLEPKFFQQGANNLKFGALVTPFSYDWDADGDEDLICGNSAGYIGFIENLDGGNPPKWASPVYLKANGKAIRIMAGPNGSIQGPCEAKWGYTTLNVADWNQDSLPDIVANSSWGRIVWFENIGSRKQPQLKGAQPVTVEYAGKTPKPAWNWWNPNGKELVTQWRTTPVVIDYDKDGLNDLIILDQEGYLALFRRAKKDNKLILLPGERIFHGEDVCQFNTKQIPINHESGVLKMNVGSSGGSGRRKICFVDWDLDGRLDILVNSKNINFLKNISSDAKQNYFRDMGMVDQRVLAGHTTSPTVVDWDKNGIPDLLVGAEDGFLYYMPNPHAAGKRKKDH